MSDKKSIARVIADPKPDTRESLLEAAKKVFSEKGFDGTTVKDLSDAAGVNVSLVSYHFGGKEGLYRTCLESFGLSRVEAAERILKTPTSREDFVLRLKLFAEDFIDINMRESELCRMIHRGLETMNPITVDLFKNVFFRLFESFQTFIANTSRVGVLRDDLDPMMVASTLFGALMHMVRTDSLRESLGMPTLAKDPKFADDFVEHWAKIATEGIFANATPNSPKDSNA